MKRVTERVKRVTERVKRVIERVKPARRSMPGRLRVIAAAALVTACAATRPQAPSADEQPRPVPDLGGRSVMVLPVQAATPFVALPASADSAVAPVTLGADALRALDAELAFWLGERAARTTWVASSAVERAAERAPMLDVRPRELAVRDILRARLTQIGDPLFGDLRGLSMLVDARLALLPIGAVWIAERGGGGRIHVALAIIDTFNGAVRWQGVIAGTATPQNDASAIAAVAQAIAARVQP